MLWHVGLNVKWKCKSISSGMSNHEVLCFRVSGGYNAECQVLLETVE